jgi:hypothetical protein
MSSGKSRQPSASPALAGVDASEVSTNQRSVPAHWFCGEDWCALSWLTATHYPRYVEIKQKVGKKSTKVGEDVYGSLGGLACAGMVDAIAGIEIDKQIIWTGNVQRSDNVGSNYYYKATITTSAGKFHIYWGRPDQPFDTVLLARLNAAGFTHPAYRRQCIVICDDTYFGQNKNSAPSIRVKLLRTPKPRIGNFPTTITGQGASMVGAALELMTDTMFGAGMPTKHFTASQYETLSADVITRVGCHSPSLDREQPLKDIVRDLFGYFDGWCRLEKQVLTPGCFPHNGVLPADIPTLTHHDFTERPKLPTRKVARAANSIIVKFRDGSQKHREDSVGATAAANRRVRQRVQPEKIDMPAIIDRAQALAYAQTAARAAKDKGNGQASVRTARAINPTTGGRLRAGDNFILQYAPFNYSRAVRITKRTENYKGGVVFDVVPERGCYPQMTPVTPEPLPNLGVALPQPVGHARVFELTPDLAGSPIGIYIAVLAQRPVAKYPAPHDNLTAQNISGAMIHYSCDGASYDYTGAMVTWAVRGTLLEPLDGNDAGTLARVQFGDDNIDLDCITAQSEAAQLDDSLMMLVGDELMSIGAIQLEADARRFAVMRQRQGTKALAHAAGTEVWLMFRDELGRYAHAQFAGHGQAHFKLETLNPGNRLALSEAPDIAYTFRDRTPEAPAILFDALPADPQVGVAVTVGVQFGDSNGDLDRYKFEAERLDVSIPQGDSPSNGKLIESLNIAAGAAMPVEKTILTLRLGCVFPRQGTWRLRAIASDLAGNTGELYSDPFTVIPNTTGIFEVVPTPPAVPTVAADGGFQQLLISLRQERIIEVLGWQLSVQTQPGHVPAVTHDGLQNLSLTLNGLAASATRYVRARAVGKNGLNSEWSAEVAGTASAVSTESIAQTAADLRDVSTRLAAEIIDRENLGDAADTAITNARRDIQNLADATDAICRDIASMFAMRNDQAAGLQHEMTVRADAVGALVRDVEDLLAIALENKAGISRETEARADAINAAVRDIDAAFALTADAVSGLTHTTQLTSGKLDALTTDVYDLLAMAEGNSAGLQQEREARTDAFKSVFRDIASLYAIRGEQAAFVQTFAEAFLDANGKVCSRWGVKLDSNGWISGVEAFNGGAGNDYFDILASSFRVRHPGASAVIPFEVAAGALKAMKAIIPEIESDMIKAGAITAREVGANKIVTDSANLGDAVVGTANIKDLAVDTLKIANQAVTIPLSAFTAGGISAPGGQWVTLQILVIGSSGAPIFCFGNAAPGATGWVDIYSASQSLPVSGNVNVTVNSTTASGRVDLSGSINGNVNSYSQSVSGTCSVGGQVSLTTGSPTASGSLSSATAALNQLRLRGTTGPATGLRIKRDGVVIACGVFSVSCTDTPGQGMHTYTLEGTSQIADTVNFTDRSLLLLETKR